MQVASQHAKAVSEGARNGVEERLLLNWVTLDAANVPPWNVQLAAAVVANLADSCLALGNGAGVSAGVAAEAIAIEVFDQLGRGLAHVRVENVFEGGHLGRFYCFRCRR